MARITTRWLLRGGTAALDLTQSEALVLLKLIDHAEYGVAWCPQTHISRDLGIARSTVQEALGALLHYRALAEVEPGRRGRATRYEVGTQEDVKGRIEAVEHARSSVMFRA